MQNSRELRSGAESFRMPAHLSCLQVQQLLRMTEHGRTVGPTGKVHCSRTVGHLTDEPSGDNDVCSASTWVL